MYRLFELIISLILTTQSGVESVLKLKRGGKIFLVPFLILGMDSVRTPETLEVDEIGEFVSDPKNVSYIQELDTIHVKGILWLDKKSEVVMVFGQQFKLCTQTVCIKN